MATRRGVRKQAPSGASATPSVITELGVSGLRRTRGWIREEFLPDLRGARGRRVFREMALNDATVGAVLFTYEQLIRQVEWRVVEADRTPEGLLARDLVKGALFEDMSHTWQDALSEMLDYFEKELVNAVAKSRRQGVQERDLSPRVRRHLRLYRSATGAS